MPVLIGKTCEDKHLYIYLCGLKTYLTKYKVSLYFATKEYIFYCINFLNITTKYQNGDNDRKPKLDFKVKCCMYLVVAFLVFLLLWSGFTDTMDLSVIFPRVRYLPRGCLLVFATPKMKEESKISEKQQQYEHLQKGVISQKYNPVKNTSFQEK